MMKLISALLTATLLSFSFQAQAADAQLNGAGSTFVYPVFAQWAATYYKNTGAQINYQAIGSGGGIRQIIKGTVDFAASDAPLTEKQLKEENLVQYPLIMGGVIPTINLRGIEANELKLDGETLAAIFAGKITQWNDKRIQALNPELELPERKITVVHRADGSGTTWIFTNYLSKVSESWEKNIGFAKAVSWNTGIGAKGNAGVANYINRIPGAIGYLELAFVLENHMTSIKLKNAAGNFVAPTLDNLEAAAANADWKGTPGYAVILTNQPGANSWPITGATFILMHKPLTGERNQVLRKFLDWSWHKGDEKARELAYVPLPQSLVDMILADWPTAK